MTWGAGSVATLALSTPDRCCLTAVSRPDGPRDDVDPVSELAVLAAAADRWRAALAIPIRLRDVEQGDVVACHTLLTTLVRHPDGGVRISAQGVASSLEGHTPMQGARTWAVDPAQSPVAPLLFDAVVRVDEAPRLHQVVAVLRGWGHRIEADDGLPDVDRAMLGRDRYRVHRLARELGHRNRPTAPIGMANRPGVPANLPTGFIPACPF